MKPTQANLNIWRESASLILAAKSNFFATSNLNFNYKLLCLQRSSRSKVLANSYVFPGGNISESDSSVLWVNLFEKFGFDLKYFKELIYPVKNVPTAIRDENLKNCLPKYLALRICAIRETFEECGILVCKSGRINYRDDSKNWASYVGGSEIIKWQHKVHDDPYQFLKLCTQMNIYPDVCSLHNWSNWVTPHGIPDKYNAMFFISFFDQEPSINREIKEIQNTKWAVPGEYIEEDQRQKLVLPVPQFYEHSRIRNFNDIESFAKHAIQRSNNGCEEYFPYRVNTKEGMYFIFPGDELYADKLVTTDVSDDIPPSKIQNRLLLDNRNVKNLFVKNFVPRDGHLPPKM